jgi:hypothetical protein
MTMKDMTMMTEEGGVMKAGCTRSDAMTKKIRSLAKSGAVTH